MFAEDNPALFAQAVLSDHLEACRRQVRQIVDGLPQDQFLSITPDTLVEHVSSRLNIAPLSMYKDRMSQISEETDVDVSHDRMRAWGHERSGSLYVKGVRIVVSLPFTGDSDLWHLRPSSFQSVFPHGNVRSGPRGDDGSIEIILEQPSDSPPEDLAQLLQRQVQDLEWYVQAQRREVEQYNKTLPELARRAAEERRTRIERNDQITAALGIPLQKRPGAPEIRPLPMKKRLVRPLPAAPRTGFKPEPGVTQEDYEHILAVIRHEGRTFETTPRTYAVHPEEELRDILLAHLNGHYQGEAGGEIFRKYGKTDIRIEDQNRAAFIAECKVWHGPKAAVDACDQMLDYLTWRDCKTALIFFNKQNKDFSKIVDGMPSLFNEHPSFLRSHATKEQGEWRFVLFSPDDPAREITVNIFVFDLFVPDNQARS